MEGGVDAEGRRRFLWHLLGAVVTLGLYMPVWLARWDVEVRDHVGEPAEIPSAWALGAGAALGLISRGVFGQGSPGLASALSLLGVAVFLAGVYQVADGLAGACEKLGLDQPPAPAVVTGLLAVAFVGVEVGNQVASWWVRAPVIAVIVALPYVFWRLHLGFEGVRALATS